MITNKSSTQHENDNLCASELKRILSNQDVDIYGLGTTCLVAIILRLAGMRHSSLPFDWIISNPQMIAHCLDDDFKEFLNSTYYEPSLVGDIQPYPIQHRFYFNHFNAANVFVHHQVHTAEGHAWLKRCVERFRAAARSTRKKIYIIAYVTDDLNDDLFNLIRAKIASYATNARVIYLNVRHVHDGILPVYDLVTQEASGSLYTLTVNPVTWEQHDINSYRTIAILGLGQIISNELLVG